MASTAYYWRDYCLLACMETTFGTPDSDDTHYRSLPAANVKLDLNPDVESLQVLTGQVGADPARIVGARKWKLTFELPMQACSSVYIADPVTKVLGTTADLLAPWFPMLASALGGQTYCDTNANFWLGKDGKRTSAAPYAANKVKSATASAVVLDDEATCYQHQAGEFYMHALDSALTDIEAGWCKVSSESVPESGTYDTITFREDAQNTVNSDNAEVYGTLTAWISSSSFNPDPLTFRLVGVRTRACKVLAGGVPVKMTMRLHAGKTPILVCEYQGFEYFDDIDDGGLVVPPGELIASGSFAWQPPLSANNNARLTLNGSAYCGAEDVEISWIPDVKEVPCHGSGVGGVSDILYTHHVEVKCWIPWTETIAAVANIEKIYDSSGTVEGAFTEGQNYWQSSFESTMSTSTFGFGVESLPTIGKCFAVHVPAARVYEVPKFEEKDGSWGYALTLRAAAYSGDTMFQAETTANSPINATMAVGIG